MRKVKTNFSNLYLVYALVMSTKFTLEDYLNLNYTVFFYVEDDNSYTVEIRELPGCVAQGENIEEALEAIDEARQLWLETAYEEGDDIPLPQF